MCARWHRGYAYGLSRLLRDLIFSYFTIFCPFTMYMPWGSFVMSSPR